MLHQKLLTPLFIIVLIAGCDPIRTTTQRVMLVVLDSKLNQPEEGVQVSLTYDCDNNKPMIDQGLFIRGAENKWFTTYLTDNRGIADIRIRYSSIDHTFGPIPPSWRSDLVIGRTYRVRLIKDKIFEELRLVLQPKATAQSESFIINILDIKQPRYIERDQGEW